MKKSRESYVPLVSSILKRCGLIRRRSLLKILINYDDEVGNGKANKILDHMESKFLLLSNHDDIIFTIGTYRRLNPDDYKLTELDWNTGTRRIRKSIKLNFTFEDTAILDCMDLVADLSPDSLNFALGSTPWYVQFMLPKMGNIPARLFQITKVRTGYEVPTQLMLLNLPRTTNNYILKENIRRIAIVEDESTAKLVPFVGFNLICVMDENEKEGYRVIENRSIEEAWDEYQF